MNGLSGLDAADQRDLPDSLWEDGERRYCRIWRTGTDGARHERIAVLLDPDRQTPASVSRHVHEFALRESLDSAWAMRPLELVQERGQTMLVLEHFDGGPLDRLVASPMETGRFLRISVHLLLATGRLHESGLVHKDIKPTHVLVNSIDEVRLTGFGIASRLRRERQAPEPPEIIAGTLPYMAPEQTGRINRSMDSRSDLYSLGVVLYQMATGALPFDASEPMEWVHCHIARMPKSPRDRLGTIPTQVSALIMRLLAKNPDERYQTAAGAEHDMRRCLSDWETTGRTEAFPLGERDIPDRLIVPEKLYGRAREIESLISTFGRVVQSGAPELVLVSGYPGVGKSSVVNEVHRRLAQPQVLFAAGKFEQFRRDIPYSTLAQAFQSLVRPLLAKDVVELGRWREALLDALGPNGQLMVDLVPELKLIIGEQASVPELPSTDAQRRFQRVFRRFVAVFARPEHPLLLFLDDLQWLDAATLGLLEDLLDQNDVLHVLLIGAYRDSEVSSTHPLMRTLERMRGAGAQVQEIVFAPLALEQVRELIADSLYCAPEHAMPLAELVYHKTAGNPFFVIQFLYALFEEGLLTFEHGAGRWSWDLARIHAKGYTDNVVDLMIEKLVRLPIRTQEALRQLACLGNGADISLLARLRDVSPEELVLDLAEALRTGLVLQSRGYLRFLHDRVQEAAYSLIPEAKRAKAHLRTGRLLAHLVAPERRDEAIFEIVNQLNRGVSLITSREEREQLAEFNLSAGRRAKISTAYVSALNYLVAGTTVLSDDARRQRPDLVFLLELHRAECEFLTGELEAAEARLTRLSSSDAKLVDRATVAYLRSDLYTTLSRSDRAVDVCLAYLRHLGIDWSPHPSDQDAQREYDRLWSLLGNREIEDLIDLPLVSDPESVATLDVLAKALVPASLTDANLFSLLLCRMVNLSMEHGNADASCQAYVHIARVAGPCFGNHDAGRRFARLGYELVERRGLRRYQARTYMAYAVISVSWTHLRFARGLIRHAFEAANAIGDLTYAAFSCHHLIANLLAAGDSLVDTEREAERGLQFVQNARFGGWIDVVSTQLALARTLRGLTATFGSLSDGQLDELQFESRLASGHGLAFAASWYWIRKMQARYFAGDHAAAVDASVNAQRLLSISPSVFRSSEAHYYGALSRAAACVAGSSASFQQHFAALTAHHKQLSKWAESCPENFVNRAMLVGAEIARVEGRELDAERLYESAIVSARENGFVHHQALSAELAARFHAARGFETIAAAYMREARLRYSQWGAAGKVRQLEARYPYLREVKQVSSAATIVAPVEQLDLDTVIKVSQTVSGEIVLEKLIDTVMRAAIEQAGAERSLLILARGGTYRIEAEASNASGATVVSLVETDVGAGDLPASIFQYVVRTRESVLLPNASENNQFVADDYIRARGSRSVLCLPLINQARLLGVLYLENSLSGDVFTPARISILKLLASQAGISLENSRLYRDLEEREARVRRLFNANIIGIFTWRLDGRILDANQAFLRIVGYGSEDLDAGRLSWKDLMPAEWDESDDLRMTELLSTRVAAPFEAEYVKRDGGRVPVLVGAALFDGTPTEGVAFVLDLTERKAAEEALSKAGTELAHVSRVSALSALTASIAHEINQPLAGIVTNAGTSLRMLNADPPDIEGARETARRTIRDGNRAADVVARLRALFGKREFALEAVDLNEATREVIALSSNDLLRQRIVLELELGEDLPWVAGDRIQLQQVILNLLRNAVEAMSDVRDRPRQIWIATEPEDGDRVRLSVRDAGTGLSRQSLDTLFNAFHTTKSGGMGIGLFVCRSIIEKHQGRLWAQPNDATHGATFAFSIRRAAQDRQAEVR